MSILEALMLVCFGAAWPFSIYKSWKTRTTAGKSVVFLWIVLIGYLAGLGHKLLFSRDAVIFFYALNTMLVAVDLALYYRNARLSRRST
mgnify:CR=1 FL=1